MAQNAPRLTKVSQIAFWTSATAPLHRSYLYSGLWNPWIRLLLSAYGVDPSAAADRRIRRRNLFAENPPEKLRRAELAAEFC